MKFGCKVMCHFPGLPGMGSLGTKLGAIFQAWLKWEVWVLSYVQFFRKNKNLHHFLMFISHRFYSLIAKAIYSNNNLNEGLGKLGIFVYIYKIKFLVCCMSWRCGVLDLARNV